MYDIIITNQLFTMAVKSIVSAKCLRIASSNYKHSISCDKFDSDCDFYKDHAIVSLQEHCFYDSQLHRLKVPGDVDEVTSKSFMDETRSLEGRLYSGCASIYKASLNCRIRHIARNHVRLCGVIV